MIKKQKLFNLKIETNFFNSFLSSYFCFVRTAMELVIRIGPAITFSIVSTVSLLTLSLPFNIFYSVYKTTLNRFGKFRLKKQ